MAINLVSDGSGDKAGAAFVMDLQTAISQLYSNNSGANTPNNPAVGELWHDVSADRLKIFIGPASDNFATLPFVASTGALSVAAGISGVQYSSLDFIDENLITGTTANDSIPSASAVVDLDNARGVTTTAEIGTHNTDTGAHSSLSGTTIANPILTGTIRGSGTMILDPDPDGNSGTLQVNGNLTVNGTTTTINSTVQSHTDKDIILAAGATDNAGVTSAGILLGSPTTLESWLYDGTNWAASAPVKAESFLINTTTVVDSSTNWTGGNLPAASLTGTIASGRLSLVAGDIPDISTDKLTSGTLGVARGGTGVATVTANSLLRGNNANAMVETTIGDGLKLTSNSLDVDPTELGVEEFNNIPSTFGSPGNALVVNSGGTALEYSNSVVDIAAVESWARVSGGAGTTALTNRVLVHNGTDAATGYAWVDANDSNSLDVGLGATEAISVASVQTSGNNTVGGNLTVGGNTDLGDVATDTLTISANIDSDVIPSTNNARDLGSNTRRWAEVHTNNLALDGNTLSAVATTGTLTDSATTAASSKSVRDYISGLSLGGSVVIEAVGGTAKDIDADALAVVTISGITKIFTAKVARTGVVKGTDFDGTGSGQDFTNTTNWTEFTAIGGTQVTINKFTGNGTLFEFTLTTTPDSENDINVFIDGVYQLKDAYTLSGSTLSFGTGNTVPSGSKVEVLIGTTVNFASGSIGNVTASGTITAPTIGTDLTTTLRGDGSNISGLPAGYTGWTVSDGTTTSLTSSGETLTVTDGGGTTAVVSDNTLTISSPSLGTGSTQAALGNHDHEGTYTEPKGGNGTSTEGFFADTNGTGISKTVRFRYRNSGGTLTTLASISVSDILDGVTIDDLG